MKNSYRTDATQHSQRGATMVESAVVLGVFLLILFGMFDLGIAVLKRNSLAESARRLAREASLRGALSAPEKTPWGPTEMTGVVDGSAIEPFVSPVLLGADPADVRFSITWPDGGNEVGKRVNVKVSHTSTSIASGLLGVGDTELVGESTMRISH